MSLLDSYLQTRGTQQKATPYLCALSTTLRAKVYTSISVRQEYGGAVPSRNCIDDPCHCDVRYWHEADINQCTALVRYWHKADMGCCTAHVRFRG